MKDRVEKFKQDAILINESISWVENEANSLFDELDKIEDCSSDLCEERRVEIVKKITSCFNKLYYEDRVLEGYGRELSEFKKTLNSSGINI